MDTNRHTGHRGPAAKTPGRPAREQAPAIGNDVGSRGYGGDSVRREVGTGPPSGWMEQPCAQGNAPDGTLIATDRLERTPVYGSEDALLGYVRHVLVDLAEGCIAFIVIELEGAAGGALCVVPWPALDVDPGMPRFSLAHTVEDLRQAPTFDPAHWPPLTDTAWLNRVYLFFDCLPYWVPSR